MTKRTLFAAIAATIMVGCTADELVRAGDTTAEKSAVPVQISFADNQKKVITDSTHTAVAIVANKDGSKDSCKLDITTEGISGIVKDVDANDTAKVEIEIRDRNGKLEYKGVDLVKKKTDREYDKVHMDLHKVDRDPNKKTDNDRICDKNVVDRELDATQVRAYLTLLVDMLDVDPELKEVLVQQIAVRQWTEKDLYLIEELARLMFTSKESKDSVVIFDRDTVVIKEDGTVVDPKIDSVFISFGMAKEMIDGVAREYGINNEKLYVAVKENTPVLHELWPINAKEEVYMMIVDQAKKIKGGAVNDSTGLTGCFTENQLKDMALAEAKASNVSGEKLLNWLRENGFFKKQYNFGQKDEVYSWIKKGIYVISVKTDDSTVTNDSTKVDSTVTNDSTKVDSTVTNDSTKVDSTVVDPVITIVTADEIAYTAKNMARETNTDPELLLSNLRMKTKLFTVEWNSNQWGDIYGIIKMEISAIQKTDGSTDSVTVEPAIISTEEITKLAKTMAIDQNVSAEKLISYLRLATPLYTETWYTTSYDKVKWVIQDAITTQFKGGDNVIDNTITDPNTGVKDTVFVKDSSGYIAGSDSVNYILRK